MGQFVAILKDSFREAVDGFVIYLMLALSVILIVLAASISYVPSSAEDSLPELLTQFNLVFPDRGASAAPTGSPDVVLYKATNVQDTPNGAKFVLEVNPQAAAPKPADGKADAPAPKPPLGGRDGFRHAVFAWKSPPGEKIKNPMAGKNKGAAQKGELEILTPPTATEADLRAVTDDDLTAFLKSQFDTFGGLSDVTVSRRAGVAEPGYAYDVEVKGVQGARGWPHQVYVFFGAVPPIKKVPLGLTLYVIQNQIVNGIGAAVALMISVVITAFFIPNLLRKGSVDLLVSKPIGRSQLLVYKYIGGLTFIFLISTVAIGGVWLVMAARSGSWNPTFLLVIPILTFTFGILYSVSTLVAVFTRSAIAAIMITLGFMFMLYVFGNVKTFFDMNRVTEDANLPEWSYTLVDTVNNVLPRYKDLDKITGKLLADSTMPTGLSRLAGIFTEFPSWPGAIGVSLAFIAVMLLLSCWRFSRRDY